MATDSTLARACYPKGGLRVFFKISHDEAGEALDRWVAWARRCRIPPFAKQPSRFVKHRAEILASIEPGLSKDRIESMDTNTRNWLITRMAFGFKSPDKLITLAMLTLGGHKPVFTRPEPTHGYVRRVRICFD